jgi:hypothetical protein
MYRSVGTTSLLVLVLSCSPKEDGLPAHAASAQQLEQASSLEKKPFLVALRAAGPSEVDEIAPVVESHADLRISRRFRGIFRGFAAMMTATQADKLRRHPLVRYVEQDGGEIPQVGWNLERVHKVDKPAPYTGAFTPTVDQGANSVIYVLDSGVLYNHDEFITGSGNSRASFGGWQAYGLEAESAAQPDGIDCNKGYPHGTMVASVAAGKTYGIATAALVRSIRTWGIDAGFFGGEWWNVSSPCNSASMHNLLGLVDDQPWVLTASIVAGLEHVWETHTSSYPNHAAVVNISSISSSNKEALGDAVRDAVNSGITVVLGAGNQDNMDSCKFAPANASEAITVGASMFNDERWDCVEEQECGQVDASGSGSGYCVDIYAPGHDISVARIPAGEQGCALNHSPGYCCEVFPGSPITCHDSRQGTSLAAPAVAGAAAIFLSRFRANILQDPAVQAGNMSLIPAYVRYGLIRGSSKDKLTKVGDYGNNRLLYVDSPLVTPLLEYRSRVETFGWQPSVFDTEISGTTDRTRRIEGFQLGSRQTDKFSVAYTVYQTGRGWLPEVQQGTVTGYAGERVEALKARVVPNGDANRGWHIAYRPYAQTGSGPQWLSEVSDNSVAGFPGSGLNLEAINLRAYCALSCPPGYCGPNRDGCGGACGLEADGVTPKPNWGCLNGAQCNATGVCACPSPTPACWSNGQCMAHETCCSVSGGQWCGITSQCHYDGEPCGCTPSCAGKCGGSDGCNGTCPGDGLSYCNGSCIDPSEPCCTGTQSACWCTNTCMTALMCSRVCDEP